MKFSRIELRDLFKAWLALSLAFGILLSGGLSGGNLFSSAILVNFLVSAFTVGVGFLFHELAHKFVAQRYNCYAEFRSFDSMLILAIVMSFFGFILAAPGAVMIRGWVDVVRNGKISVAGPVANLILALIFFVVMGFGITGMFVFYGALINSLLAAFNMIPFGNFDGAKVLRWNKGIYFLTLGIAVIFLFLSYGG